MFCNQKNPHIMSDMAAAWAAYYASQQQAAPGADPNAAAAWAAYYASAGYAYPPQQPAAAAAAAPTLPPAPSALAAAEAVAPKEGASAGETSDPAPAAAVTTIASEAAVPSVTPYAYPPSALYASYPGMPASVVAPLPPLAAPRMEPPPPLPEHLRPYAQPQVAASGATDPALGGSSGVAGATGPAEEGLPPQPGQEEFYRRPDNWPGRTYLVRYVGEAIHRAQETPLNIRHDILIEKRVIGRILGKGGRDLEALQLCTGSKVFIIDKYPPPERVTTTGSSSSLGSPRPFAWPRRKSTWSSRELGRNCRRFRHRSQAAGGRYRVSEAAARSTTATDRRRGAGCIPPQGGREGRGA